ncbi:hypothetical protein [Nocardioides sp. B-3]
MSEAELAAMHGVGPIAIDRLGEALAEQGSGLGPVVGQDDRKA